MSKTIDLINDVEMPVPRAPNELVKLHGPSGWLMLRLQRYALIGWLAFFLLAIVFVLYIFAGRLAPQAVLAVDEGGRLLGQFDYMSPEARSDQELVAGATFFLERYLSVNSATVYNDYATALNMMQAPLREAKMNEVRTTGYLTQIDKANSRSYLTFSDGAKAPQLLERRGLQSLVRLQGTMVIVMTEQTVERPFDVTLEMSTVARNRLATQGLVIDAIRNN